MLENWRECPTGKSSLDQELAWKKEKEDTDPSSDKCSICDVAYI